MTMPKKVMIVEDEVITQRFLQDIFAQYDATVVGCFDNAQDVLNNIKSLDTDMILMDININGPMDGIQLARKILEKHDVPIVFITAHNDEETVDETLELAPYGFICKPFTGKDVVVTIQIAHKRFLSHSKVAELQAEVAVEQYISIGENYRYDLEDSQLYKGEHPIDLTKNQHLLLKVLAENIDQVVSYDTIIAAVWEDAIIADSALRTLVYSVRKLLPDLPIVSHSKIGYSLER